ncbi:hypothetical protein [Silvibacterium dinghuense]|uniref:Uncharacterized protein n=1 Tax=Silvibacterium dinghuense TaxID=1560006 RepID=A0A4Q1SIJ6_9BACT|nr:hypothetical protein [Silvibacterium dinghuense]RXS97431.1 hypothetical protein ESZ00_05915 [Silvibacterium dinghuense]GGG98971.1 hypothetical protein GCM10011586_13060 [Silvibacterium dinghuense]
MNQEASNKETRSRLNPASEQALLPIRRARDVSACALYWLPVSNVPAYGRERDWLQHFFDELHLELTVDNRLRQESFLQMKLTAPQGYVKDALHRHQTKLMPLMGLGRKPNGKIPPIPTEEDLDQVIKGKAKFDFNEYVADYVFWFLERNEAWKRELFLGSGGYTMIYLPHDPATTPPPIPDYPVIREMPAFKKFDADALWQATFLLGDAFCEKSKQVFGKGLEEELAYEGLTFILPFWKARDFLAAASEELSPWFEVFDIFITESPDDHGMLIAAKDDLDETLIRVLDCLRAKEEPHPVFEPELETQR